MKYAIITNSEDGIRVDVVDRDQLLDRITPDKDGYTYYGKKTILSEYPKRIDMESFNTDHLLVLEVRIANIVPVTTVTKYEIKV